MFKLEEATITDIQQAVAAKKISCRELVMLYLERIAEVDFCYGGLNSVAEINIDALEIASMMDEERAKGRLRGSMHGIPILIKDNILTGDGMRTTAGSLAFGDWCSMTDAIIVGSLRQQGAIPIGKTNLTEFANWMTEGMPNGYSSRGGQVFNPYNREADASGSSTGSAVAVAANLCVASVGTETHGSIIAPSFVNGIVGIKPTAGLLSGYGIVPISSTLDTPGPMARTVRDAAILLGSMISAGYFRGAAFSAYTAFGMYDTGNPHKDYTLGLDRASLRGLQIGVYGNPDDKDDEFNTALEAALREIESAGAIIMRNIQSVVPDSPWQYMGAAIASYEFKPCINQFLVQFNSPIQSLADIIRFNEANGEKCLKYGQTTLVDCESGNYRVEYIKALARREKAINDLDGVFDNNKFDVLIGAAEHQGIAPITGFPSGTIPIGTRKNGVPVGMYFIARRFDEAGLIHAMHAAEQLVGKRKPPTPLSPCVA